MPYLTPEQKTYLIGKRYEAEKHCNGGDRRSKAFSEDQKDPLKKFNNTAARIANDVGCAEVMVKRAEHFAQALDKVATVQTDM